jgi:uncharacterized protein (UPF0261 family)
MVTRRPDEDNSSRPIVFLSMFGNTTPCVEECVRLLEQRGYDTMVFHATGTGGRALEELTLEGYPVAVLDVTTTELADEVAGGVFSAGGNRLDSPGMRGIPHLIVPGCIDMVNFGPMDTVPARYRDAGRQFFTWSPMVTLMRTTCEENEKMGKLFAEKANKAKGPVRFLFPLKGVSELDGANQPFCDWAVDRIFFETVKNNVNPEIEIDLIDANINDPVFAERCVIVLDSMMSKASRGDRENSSCEL